MEINFMKTIGRHENVVTMLGCCTLYPPLCLVVEYVPHGDLLHYLRNLRKAVSIEPLGPVQSTIPVAKILLTLSQKTRKFAHSLSTAMQC